VAARKNSSPLEGEEAKAWTYLSKAKSKSLAFAGEGACFRKIRNPLSCEN
jgi:hypothetical protein